MVLKIVLHLILAIFVVLLEWVSLTIVGAWHLFYEHPYLNILRLTGPMTCHPVWCDWPLQAVLPLHAPYDITGGRVQLDVSWPTRWTVANAAHLSATRLGGLTHL